MVLSKIVTERLKKDIIKLVIDEVVIEGESVKIFATIPLPNKIHEREMDKTDIPGTFNAGATLGPVNETNMARIWNKHKQSNTPLKRKVLVGMSGGVDSSVAAALLVKRGYKVVGGFIKNWSDSKDIWSGECAWRGERRDALRVAAKLGIPLLTFDFEDQYRKYVVSPLFDGYAQGSTPNPDVLCNQFIKFGLFFHAMKRLKLDFVATGHYAQVRRDRSGVAHLYRGRDPEKDQSYFLHRVDQAALRHAMFPIGDKKKPEVRRLARSLGVPTAEKKESMGICFIGKQDMTKFLRTRIPSKPGNVVDPNGRVIGRHAGLDSVTVGQRHGFSVSQPVPSNGIRGPWYAAVKDPATNCLMVAPGRGNPALYASEAAVGDLHCPSLSLGVTRAARWLSGQRGLSVSVRYRQEAAPVSVKAAGRGKVRLVFKKPVFAVAPGQSAVIYKGKECLGGGVIL